MRWLVLVLAAVLLVPAPAGAQQAWVKAYEDGVEAFQKGNDALAEAKLLEAREKGPKQSRRHNFSSVVYRPFIPDFYLGVIYARTGRHGKAQEFLERALRDELVKQDDKANFALANTSLQKIREDQTRLATNTTTRPTPPVVNPTPPVTPPANNTAANNPTTPANTNPQRPNTTPNNTTTPPVVRPPVTPPATVEPSWLPGFRRAMEAAGASLRQGRYAEARNSLGSVSGLPVDAARRAELDALRRDIDTAQTAAAQRLVEGATAAIRQKNIDAASTQVARLEALSPGHVALPGLRGNIERMRGDLQGAQRVSATERLGVKLFLEGNYQSSAVELERAVGSGVSSPRIYLFLASSRAALALLAPEGEKDALVSAARKHYEQAKPAAAALAADQRFISPSIQKLLAGG